MEASKVSVNFACQRCQHPIHISDGFDRPNEHVLAELTLPINSHLEVDLDSQTMSFDQYVPPFRLTDSGNGTNGFTVISDSSADAEPQKSHKMMVKAELFDKLSSHSDTNHPLCVECTDTMIEMIDNKLALAEQDRIDFEKYLDELDTTEECTDLEKLDSELAALSLEEETLLAELNGLKSQEESLKTSLKKQEEEEQRLKEEQLKFNREYTKFRRELMITEDEKQSVDNQLMYAQMQLDKIKNTNVFDATFHIWHDGHFGTINKFRLGRLPSVPVDWSEINAAWGQTALLLASLARKMNLTFKRYKLVPYGDHSYITELKTGKHLPLHGIGGIKFYFDTKFDSAMVAFLDCFQQFHEEVEKSGSGFCLPYKMDKGKIENSATGIAYSIKVQLNSEGQWTKALKFLLTNLKWGLAWVSSQFVEE